MRTSRFLWLLAAACLAMQANADDDYSSEELQRLIMRNVRHLCEWSKTTAPPGNPVVIRACEPDGDSSVERAGRETDAWWRHWADTDEAAFDRLRKEWDAELVKTNAQYDAERKAAARKKAKAERDRVVKTLPTMSVADVCRHARRGKMPEAVEELVRRKTFPASETSLIAGGRIDLGMSEGSMLCALGGPKRANRSVGSWGTHIQYVYETVTVYVEDGKVTSWQD